MKDMGYPARVVENAPEDTWPGFQAQRLPRAWRPCNAGDFQPIRLSL
jgi:hypothetical protein